jgi:hypothetical protein
LAEQTLRDLDGGESEPRESKDLIDHWVQVIDRWVENIDQGMGGTTDGADPAMAPDAAPEARRRWRPDDHQEGGSLALPIEGDEVYLDKQLVITRTGSPGGLSVSGSIDYYNAEAVASALSRELHAGADGAAGLSDAITGNGDLHIDVSRLEFADVTGIRALVRIAESGQGRRLVLRGLPPPIRTVITVVGWSDLPNLVLEDGD